MVSSLISLTALKAKVHLLVFLLTPTTLRAKVCLLVLLSTLIAPKAKVLVTIVAKAMAVRAKKWAVRRLRQIIQKVLSNTGRQKIIFN